MKQLTVFAFFTLMVFAPEGTEAALECQLKADVVFIIDSSRSIRRSEYKLQLEFLAKLVDEMDVGPDGTHVGALSFSEGARLEFNLNQYTDAEQVENKIKAVKFMEGGMTQTHKGLSMARENLFTAANGDRDDVPNIIIIVTDGNSRDRKATKFQADLIRQEGIKVIAVGIGNSVDYQQLAELATKNTTTYVHNVKDFNTLGSLIPNFLPAACQAVTTTMAPDITTPMSNDKPAEPCTGKKADVVFVLDKSSSIKLPDFKRQLNFVNNVIGSFNVEEPHTHVGVVTFDFVPTIEFGLNEYYDKHEMQQAVSKINYTAGSTNTYLALEMVASRVLTPKGGARKGVSRVIIVVTDGKSSNEKMTKYWADVLKKKFGAYMFAIGVGMKADYSELLNIASKPPSDHVFEVRKGYHALNSIKTNLAIRACEVQSGDLFVRCQQNAVPSSVMFVNHFAHATLPEILDTRELVLNIAGGIMTSEGKVKVGLTSSDCAQLSEVQLGQAGIYSASDFAEAITLVDEGRLTDTLSRARLTVTKDNEVQKKVIVTVVHGPIIDLDEAKRQVKLAKFKDVKFVFIGKERALKHQLLQLKQGRDNVVLMEEESLGFGKGLGGGAGGGETFWQTALAKVCEVLAPGQQLN